MENQVLDNVGVNFFFNKGPNLTGGLIDQDRLLNVINKVKSIA